MGLLGTAEGADGALAGGSLAGISGFDFSQAVTAYVREDEITDIADQVGNRFGFNATEAFDLDGNSTQDLVSQASS